MPGGLMQLVAYGAQDIYLTGNPQITFFKVVYRRYTNFAIETIEHPFIGTIAFGNRVTSKISRNGDLASKMYLKVILNTVNPLTSNFAWVRRIGHSIISEMGITIGGSVIDRQYGIWLDIWYELARQGDHEIGYAKMIGDVPQLTAYNNLIKPQYTLYIPMQFWFNKFIGLSVPLIALQYHDTIFYVQFQNAINLVVSDINFDLAGVSILDASLLVNYVYLDTEERRRFALVGHEYLIEQLQFAGLNTMITSPTVYVLDFNHPVKELYWVTINGNFNSRFPFLYYTDSKIWDMSIVAISILNNSISVGIDPRPFFVNGNALWTEVPANSSFSFGTTHILNVINHYTTSVFVNPNSVMYGTYGITSQISADVTINTAGVKSYQNVKTTLTVRDISIPLQFATDTRFGQSNPLVNMPWNYGLFIDGTVNPIQEVLLQFNGNNRFDQREGSYFNYVQPEQHHTNTPRDGINCYSFSLHPEQHQPSGTANFSRIDSSQLTLTFGDPTATAFIPSLQYNNALNQLYILALNYNILRILSGMGGIAYGSTT